MNSTFSQREFIASIIRHRIWDDGDFKDIILNTPSHNEKWHNTKFDNTEKILADRLYPLTKEQANKIIQAYQVDRTHEKIEEAKVYIMNLKLI